MRNQIHCNAKKKLVNQSSDVLDIRATNIGGRLIGKTTARENKFEASEGLIQAQLVRSFLRNALSARTLQVQTEKM
jgi:hypothetical protein